MMNRVNILFTSQLQKAVPQIPHTQITIFRETKLNILLRARHKSESNLVALSFIEKWVLPKLLIQFVYSMFIIHYLTINVSIFTHMCLCIILFIIVQLYN